MIFKMFILNFIFTSSSPLLEYPSEHLTVTFVPDFTGNVTSVVTPVHDVGNLSQPEIVCIKMYGTFL